MDETAISLPFADGEYRFWLPLPQVFELERTCGDVSVISMEERFRASIGVDEQGGFVFTGGGAAMVKEVRETIRLGLIGGATAMVDGAEVEIGPQRAKQLIEAYCYPVRPLSEGVVLAWQILNAAIFGIRLKKKRTRPKPWRRKTHRIPERPNHRKLRTVRAGLDADQPLDLHGNA